MTDAFYFARTRRMPVVLGVPLDMQRAIVSGETRYRTSAELIPDMGPMAPNPAYVARAADRIMAARNIVVLGGRGARMAGAAAACEHLAELCGGLLAETLPVRGLFDRHSRSIGVAGGFSHQVTRQAFAECDLVIAVGASLTHHTVDGGKLFPHATVIQVDANPLGINQGRQIAGIFVRADCKTGLEAIIAELGRAGQDGRRAGWDAEALARRVREEPADEAMVSVEQGLLDPRAVVSALEQALPEDWQYVNASGHCSYFSAQMRGRSADDFLTIREFGAIGNGLCYAVGAAAAKPGQTVVLIDGDGGFLMHVQELETVRRYNLPILACILNDGAFGSEIHKLRADGLDDGGAIFGRGDLGRIARGFGLRGAVVTDVRQVPTVLKDFKAGAGAMVLDCHISDQVVSPTMRRSLLR